MHNYAELHHLQILAHIRGKFLKSKYLNFLPCNLFSIMEREYQIMIRRLQRCSSNSLTKSYQFRMSSPRNLPRISRRLVILPKDRSLDRRQRSTENLRAGLQKTG